MLTVRESNMPTVKTVAEPLVGHTSPETAFLVADYPYGRKVRCRIRYWLEKDPKKGFRFVSQTENPRTLAWNAPKRSTYVRFAAAMYRDGEGRVTWSGVSEYASAEEVLTFVASHPDADVSLLAPFVEAKLAFERAYGAGRVVMTINGEPQPLSESEKGRVAEEVEVWSKARDVLAERMRRSA